MSNTLRSLLKLPITLPLRFPSIRSRVAYEMRPWFGEMKFEIPLTAEMACPIGRWDAAHSFSEIFVTGEYDAYLEEAPLPLRWIDLGCHAGYFTLYLAWKNALAGRSKDWTAYLLDADPRMARHASWTLRRNGLEAQGTFSLGMIGNAKGEREFALREGMTSSSDVKATDTICRMRCIGAEEIAKSFPPPYDLIKVDIEGAEYDFIRAYAALFRHAGHLLVEWHSRDRDGGNEAELRKLCSDKGFEYLKEIRGRRGACIDGVWHTSGVHLYARK